MTETPKNLLTRYDELPTPKKVMLGKLLIAHAMNHDQLMMAINAPHSPICPLVENLIASMERP